MNINPSTRRLAVVTGAARGIERAIALRLVKDGLDVVVSDLPDSPCKGVVEAAKALGVTCEFKICDVRYEEQIKALVDFTQEKYKRLDVVNVFSTMAVVQVAKAYKMVANAAICLLNNIVSTTREELVGLYETNVHGVHYCLKHTGAAMTRQASNGSTNLRIIVGGSLAGKKGASLHDAYVSSKFAVRGLVQSAAENFGPYGITVNSYAPGVIKTDMVDQAAGKFVELTEGMPGLGSQGGKAAYAATGAQLGALKRNGEPEEVANLVSFLASEESSFITGRSISIDGGANFD